MEQVKLVKLLAVELVWPLQLLVLQLQEAVEVVDIMVVLVHLLEVQVVEEMVDKMVVLMQLQVQLTLVVVAAVDKVECQVLMVLLVEKE